MIIVHLAQCCLIFQKESSPLFNIFRKKTSQKIVAYKPLLIKHNECILLVRLLATNLEIGLVTFLSLHSNIFVNNNIQFRKRKSYTYLFTFLRDAIQKEIHPGYLSSFHIPSKKENC